MKIPKLTDHHWVSMECPQENEETDIFLVPKNSKRGVRCCKSNGRYCASSHSIPSRSNKCHFMTYDDAKELCSKKKSGEFRLCFPEELNLCCYKSCSKRLDRPVWIETSSKGKHVISYSCDLAKIMQTPS